MGVVGVSSGAFFKINANMPRTPIFTRHERAQIRNLRFPVRRAQRFGSLAAGTAAAYRALNRINAGTYPPPRHMARARYSMPSTPQQVGMNTRPLPSTPPATVPRRSVIMEVDTPVASTSSNSIGTQTMSPKSIRTVGTTSVRGGRRRRTFKKRTYKKRGKRVSKKTRFKRSKRVSYKNGVNTRLECNQLVKDTQCVYVGNCTMAQDRFTFDVCRAIVKYMWAKEGIVVKSDTQVASFPSDTIYVLSYYLNPTAVALTSSGTAVLANTLTYLEHCQALNSLFQIVANGSDNLYQFDTFAFKTTSQSFQHTLVAAKCFMNCSVASRMSIQNVTNSAFDNTDAETVAPTPLEITTYTGTGNGTMYTNRAVPAGAGTSNNFLAGPLYGNISVIASQASSKVLDIPPKASFLQGRVHVKKKFIILPGAIHRTVLRSHFKMNFQQFMEMFNGNYTYLQQRLKYGKWLLFACEKVVNTTTTLGLVSPVAVAISTEIDFEQNVVFTGTNQISTLPFNEQKTLPLLS